MSKDSIESFLKEIDEMLKHGTMPESQRSILSRARKNALRLTDSFPFDGQKCLTDCGGLCCINIDVPINPYDVWQIVTSKIGHDFGIHSTMDLFAPIQGNKLPFAEVYLGEHSRSPQAILLFKTPFENEDFRVCPFLVSAKVIKTKRDLNEFLHGRVQNLKEFRTKNNNISLLCGLEARSDDKAQKGVKPTICRASPIGRMMMGVEENAGQLFFLQPPTNHCPCVQTTKRITLQEYIERADLLTYYKYSARCHQILAKTRAIPEHLRLLFGQMFYNFDAPAVKEGLDPATVRPPSFDAFLEIMERVLTRLCDKSKEVHD